MRRPQTGLTIQRRPPLVANAPEPSMNLVWVHFRPNGMYASIGSPFHIFLGLSVGMYLTKLCARISTGTLRKGCAHCCWKFVTSSLKVAVPLSSCLATHASCRAVVCVVCNSLLGFDIAYIGWKYKGVFLNGCGFVLLKKMAGQ